MDAEGEAVVQVGWTTTRYVRAGHGLPVLLLLSDGPRTSRGAAILRTLAREFRVVAPICDAAWRRDGPEGAADRIRGILDGLGLLEVRVVVDESLAPAVDRVLAVDRERVRGVLVLEPGQRAGLEERVQAL